MENHIPQLVENYFLVLYTKDKNLQTYNHWKSELRSYINTICKYSTKSGNKKKIIRYLLIEGFELNNPERVKSMVESKVLSDLCGGVLIWIIPEFLWGFVEKKGKKSCRLFRI